jgi:hypothetical protein
MPVIYVCIIHSATGLSKKALAAVTLVKCHLSPPAQIIGDTLFSLQQVHMVKVCRSHIKKMKTQLLKIKHTKFLFIFFDESYYS